MEEIKLDVQVRSEIGTQSCKKVRRNDCIPGVVYGGKQKTTVIKIDRSIFERIERQHKGESVVLHLSVMDSDKKLKDYTTIIKEMQHDPVTDKILHVDFRRISLTEELEVKVPIVAKGEAVGVKKDGGSLDIHIWELEVICLPTNIPAHIEIDVNNLNINDNICVKDLLLPQGVRTKHDPEDIVLTIAPPMKEEVLEAVTEEAPAEEVEPEVIKEKKEEGAAEEQPAKEKPEEKKEKKEKKEDK